MTLKSAKNKKKRKGKKQRRMMNFSMPPQVQERVRTAIVSFVVPYFQILVPDARWPTDDAAVRS